MQKPLIKHIVKYLRDTANKLESGSCELSDEEAFDLLKIVGHRALSKAEACSYLNCSRPTFDNAVAAGLIPKGRKRKGFKELVWYEDELIPILKR